MGRWRRRDLCGALLIVAAIAPASEAAAQSIEPDPRVQRSVLIFGLDDLTRPWTRLIVEGVRETLQESAPDLAVYTETLDSARFEAADYADGARDWLGRKYRGLNLDLLIVAGQEAVQFLADKNGEPWAGVPILYLESGALTIDITSSLPLATGVILENSLPAALNVITAAVPDTRRIAVLYGASAVDRARFRPVVANIRQLRPELEVADLGALAMDELLQRAATLPEQTDDARTRARAESMGCVAYLQKPCEAEEILALLRALK